MGYFNRLDYELKNATDRDLAEAGYNRWGRGDDNYGGYGAPGRPSKPSTPSRQNGRRPVKVYEYKDGRPGLIQDFETKEQARSWGRVRQGRGLNDKYVIKEYGREVGIFENGD